MQLSASVEGRHLNLGQENDAILEPEAKFMECHGLLVAHSLARGDQQKVLIQLLNPSPAPVTVRKNEKVGTLRPLMKHSENVCTVGRQHEPYCPKPEDRKTSVEKAIKQWLLQVEGVDDQEKEKLESLLKEFEDIISVGEDDLGRTRKVYHKIDTGNANPIRQPPRRLPFHQREEVRQLLDNMLSRGVVEPSQGPWSSPIVLVKKKDGSTRFCIDFRQVNGLTRKDAQPLPRIDDALDTIGECCYFSTLDLASGYWQVEVSPEDREKTAFSTPYGLYQFRVMPFGLCNAPATFQRLMEEVLAGLHWTNCLVYLDDIIVFSQTIEDHLDKLREVFSRLRDAGLKIKPTKCHLLQRSVHYLGHVVSAEGIKTDPEKIRSVSDWPTPSNRKELKQFLGLVSYYRRFVRGFSQLASPLYALTEKSKESGWTDKCSEAFFELKKRLVTAPVLTLPRFDMEFIVDTDASGDGIGAVLSQRINERELVVAYASRVLSRAERKYCATRREMLALVWAARHFRPYLINIRQAIPCSHRSQLTSLASQL